MTYVYTGFISKEEVLYCSLNFYKSMIHFYMFKLAVVRGFALVEVDILLVSEYKRNLLSEFIV